MPPRDCSGDDRAGYLFRLEFPAVDTSFALHAEEGEKEFPTTHSTHTSIPNRGAREPKHVEREDMAVEKLPTWLSDSFGRRWSGGRESARRAGGRKAYGVRP